MALTGRCHPERSHGPMSRLTTGKDALHIRVACQSTKHLPKSSATQAYAFLVLGVIVDEPDVAGQEKGHMGTALAKHSLLPKGLRVERLNVGAGRVTGFAASGASSSRCPLCGVGSSMMHSRYSRSDPYLPWPGILGSRAVPASSSATSPPANAESSARGCRPSRPTPGKPAGWRRRCW